ncbi:MAG: CoA-binding protein, partial [Actinobacteria bacterium]|nr:CoA-binding protein [Actinomycetota bacterium]
PRAEVVHGEQGYATIADAVAAVGIPDVVDVFVRSDRAGEFADAAIAAGAGAVWFQLDVIDEAAAQRVINAGMTMVMNKCPEIELRRLIK